MTRREMLGRMDAAELRDWQIYDQVYGLGDNLDLIGTLWTAIMRTMGNNPDAQPHDAVPFFKPPPREQSPEDLMRALDRFATRQNQYEGLSS